MTTKTLVVLLLLLLYGVEKRSVVTGLIESTDWFNCENYSENKPINWALKMSVNRDSRNPLC